MVVKRSGERTHSSPPAEGRNNLKKETKLSPPSSRHIAVNSLPSAFRTLKLDPALVLLNELELRVRQTLLGVSRRGPRSRDLRQSW